MLRRLEEPVDGSQGLPSPAAHKCSQRTREEGGGVGWGEAASLGVSLSDGIIPATATISMQLTRPVFPQPGPYTQHSH